MAIEINGKVMRNQQEQIYKNMKDIESLKETIKPRYTTSATLTSSSVSVAIADTNAPAGTEDGWLYTEDGLLFKITGGDDTNLLLMFYSDLKGPQGDQGEPGQDGTTAIDDNTTADDSTWSSSKIATEIAGAGKQLYQHNIRMCIYTSSTNFKLVILQILTDNATQMTSNDVLSWLHTKGYDENTKLKGYQATGLVCTSSSDGNNVYAIAYRSATAFYVYHNRGSSFGGVQYDLSSITDFEDTVITL